MRRSLRSALVLLFVPAFGLAACDDDGTSPDRLTAAEVADVYNVCALTFTPSQQAFRPADLLATVINPAPPQGKLPPTLTISPQGPQFQLAYTDRNNFSQQTQGSLRYRADAVDLAFASTNDAVADALLLPQNVRLGFQGSPKTLTVTGSGPHSVSRADYVRAAGLQSGEGLQEQISGTLSARFVAGSCS